jgi:hypothetical protein
MNDIVDQLINIIDFTATIFDSVHSRSGSLQIMLFCSIVC